MWDIDSVLYSVFGTDYKRMTLTRKELVVISGNPFPEGYTARMEILKALMEAVVKDLKDSKRLV